MSISEAHRLVMEWSKTEYSKYDSVGVRSIELSTYGCSAVNNRWYYRFDLKPVFDGNEVWGAGNWAAVLMDGTVIGSTEID
ncbi:MAG: hypothetical protein GY938_04905 [Ketobacter sp.]|nr:hypothetical protein [Ketobacter sp.]